MATDFTEETAADAVIESFGPDTDPRLREILTSLVRHLHAFAREVELTIPEWETAIDFLTRVGQQVRRRAPGVHPAVGRARACRC